MERRKVSKRPVELNQLAKFITDVATGDVVLDEDKKKNINAVELGRLGGKKRAEKLTKQNRKQIALHAARKRWKKS